MNIILHKWIPVVRRSGVRDLIAPIGLWDEDAPMRLDWPRADFDMACLELLIGLCFVADPPEDNDEWHERNGNHDVEQWRNRLEALAPWFELDSEEGPRFLQDIDDLEGKPLPLERLLIDAPGENTIKNNTDHFSKRSGGLVMCRGYSAMLLYTFQAFAPSGGAGNRTSMRGGGPMVTLIEPDENATLLETVWANVPVGEALPLDDEEEVGRTFPWSVKTITSEKKTTPPVGEHDDHGSFPHWGNFFGMPRRIRLVFGNTTDTCALSNLMEKRPAIGFVQRPNGFNYGSWTHPLSPYYRQKVDSESLPVHPKAGRFGYRNYLGIILKAPDTALLSRAMTVDTWAEKRGSSRKPPRVLVAGWAMDNMKALDFVWSRLPVPLSALSTTAELHAASAIEASKIMATNLGAALRNATNVDSKTTDPATTAKRDFYILTESAFRGHLHALADDLSLSLINEKWRRTLQSVALRLFDTITQPLLTHCSPERALVILNARRLILNTALGYTPSGKKLFSLLELEEPKKKSRKKGG